MTVSFGGGGGGGSCSLPALMLLPLVGVLLAEETVGVLNQKFLKINKFKIMVEREENKFHYLVLELFALGGAGGG